MEQRWSRHLLFQPGILAILALSSVGVGMAQSPTGNINGVVSDPSGSIIPGAMVSIVDEATAFTRTDKTNAEGIYRFPIVNPGVYTIRVEAPGFSQYVNEHVTLTARQTLEINATLKLDASATQVTVTGQAPLVNSDNGMIGDSQSSRLLNDGPRGTPIMSALGNDLGHTSVLVRDGGIGAVDFKSSGSRAGQWLTTVDGNSVEVNGNVNLAVPYQAIQEQQVTAVGAPAEYRTPLTLNAVTKGGTNELRGSFTYQLGYPGLNALAANSPPGAKRAANKPSQLGNLTAGGPVHVPKVYDGRQRSFWFFSFERVPSTSTRSPQGNVLDVPTVSMRNGLFQPYFNAVPGKSATQLRNPYTGQPFAGNVIPPSMFNPSAVKALQNYIPTPNASRGDIEVPRENFSGPSFGETSYSVFLLRFDQKITANNTASFTYIQSPFTSSFDDRLPGLGNNVLIGRNREFSFSDTHIFSSRIVNELRIAHFRDNNERHSNDGSNVGEVAAKLGMNLGKDAAFRNPYLQTPIIRITPSFTNAPYVNGQTIGGFYAQDVRRQYRKQFRDNLSIQMGRHAFKMGYDQELLQDARPPANLAIGGDQTFNGAFTGDSFGDFLLGLPQTVSRYTSNFPELDLRSNGVGSYFQDDFRVNQRLSLNLGLRFEHKAPNRESHGASVNFDPRNGAVIFEDAAAIAKLPAAFPASILKETAKEAGYPHYLVYASNSWSPRIGFAYKLSRAHDVVLRGAYDVFQVDAGVGNNFFRLVETGPFAITETFTNAITNGAPLMTLNNPFPDTVGKVPASINISGRVPDIGIPFMQQYTMSLEAHLFAGWAGTLSYVGSKTTQLYYNRQINRPRASLTPFTSSRFLYKGFNTISYFDKGATASYDAMQARLEHRYSNGLELDGMLQWISEITDEADTGFTAASRAPEDPYCRRCMRAKNPYTDSLALRVISRYELPLGRGKRFASGANRYANAVIGGWAIGSFFDALNGRPEAVYFSGKDPSNTNLRSGFAKVIPGCNVRSGDGFSAPYLNINCFTVPDPGTFGNAGYGTYRSPGMWLVSGSIFKYFSLYEDRAKLRINAVFNNAFNHPIWSGVGNSLGSPASFGRFGGQGNITATAGPRTIVFQAQVLW